MSRWDFPLDHTGRQFSVWKRQPSAVRTASASTRLAMMYGSGGVDSGCRWMARSWARRWASVTIEIDLRVGAEVERAVPTMPNDAVTGGEVLDAFESEAPVLDADVLAEDGARPVSIEAGRVIDGGEGAVHERQDAISVEELSELLFGVLIHARWFLARRCGR
jgi:hypothetical protein